jgi:Fur family ferric uptake transcriptional regulator
MSSATEVLAGAGLRPTRQRLAIVEALDISQRPMTAQHLHASLAPTEVRPAPRGPGLATVYRTLQAVAAAGFARTFRSSDGELAYKLCEPEHHHHLVCERCGTVVEIPSCEVESWAGEIASRRGFTVTSHLADIYGVCADCRVVNP